MNEKKEMLKRALKKHDLFMKIFCWILIKMGYSNRDIQALQIRNKKYVQLRKKYKSYIDGLDIEKTPAADGVNNNVWICWFQGIENAPDIVKKCYESAKYYLGDKDIHVIDESNMFDYVDIPDYILDKFKRGIISYAQMSDILRTLLLVKYGGMWLDSTVLLTGKIPEYVYEKPLFMLQYKLKDDVTISKNSWFIYSQKDNRILLAVKEVLFEYWKRENILREYFLWHNFLNLVLERYPEDAEDMYYVSEVDAHYLGYALYKPFDEKYWELIKKKSAVHKLSYYSYHTKDGKKPENTDGTFYEYVMDMKF